MMKRLIVLIILIPFMFGCRDNVKKNEKPVISVSILPLMFFAGEIAGDLLDIHIVVPPGSGPENFEPGPKEIRDLSASEMLIHINLFEVEKQVLEKMKGATKPLKTFDISKGVALIEESPEAHTESGHGGHLGGIDPHIWSSVKNARVLAINTEAALASVFPQFKDQFREKLKYLLQEIDDLDGYAREKLTKPHRKTFIIYHPALAYLAKEYGLTQLSLEEDGKNPSAQHMKELVDIARKEQIKTVFLQNQFDKNNIQSFADEIGARLVTIDPLDGNWQRNMVLMINELAISLNE